MRRTIQRDIAFMGRLHAPLEFDSVRGKSRVSPSFLPEKMRKDEPTPDYAIVMAPLGVERVVIMFLGPRLLVLAPPPVMAASPAWSHPRLPPVHDGSLPFSSCRGNMVLVATHLEWVTVLVASTIPQQFPARGFSLEKSPVFVFHVVNPLDTMLP